MSDQPIEFFPAVSEAERRGRQPAIVAELIDEGRQVYRAAAGPVAIFNVRVGGLAWDQTYGDPGPGQWTADPASGTFRLGADPLRGVVRCDAAPASAINAITADHIMAELRAIRTLVERGLALREPRRGAV